MCLLLTSHFQVQRFWRMTIRQLVGVTSLQASEVFKDLHCQVVKALLDGNANPLLRNTQGEGDEAQWMRLSSPWNLVRVTIYGIILTIHELQYGKDRNTGETFKILMIIVLAIRKGCYSIYISFCKPWGPSTALFQFNFKKKHRITLRLSWWRKDPMISQVVSVTNLVFARVFWVKIPQVFVEDKHAGFCYVI